MIRKWLLPTFLLMSALVGPNIVSSAKAAATGVVCIADPTKDPADCPLSPENFRGQVGSEINMAVNIQDSSSLNGFDIIVQSNPAVLQPASISLADSLIQDPRFIVEQSVDSTNGFFEVAMVALGYDVPGTGNLFEISFKVLSNSTATVTFPAHGCPGTSVLGVCVTVVLDGQLDNETIQPASFGFTTLDFSISTGFLDSPYQLREALDASAGSSAIATILVTAWDGFGGAVNLSATLFMVKYTSLGRVFSPCTVEPCPSVSLNSTTATPSLRGTAWATITLSAPTEQFDAVSNSWVIIVTGTSGNLTRSVEMFSFIEPPRVSLEASNSYSLVRSGSTFSTTITLRSIGGFGSVILSTNPPVCSVLCPSWDVNPNNLTLSLNGVGQTTFTFSALPEKLGDRMTSWTPFVFATSGNNFLGSLQLNFVIFPPTDFSVSVNPTTLRIPRGQTTFATGNISDWTGVNSVSVSIAPSHKMSPTATLYYSRHSNYCNPCLMVTTTNTTRPGTYVVTLVASNGWFAHEATLTVRVVANDDVRS